MPKRFFVSPIIGDGTDPNPYRAKVMDNLRGQSGARVQCIVPSNPDGSPRMPWALCVGIANDVTPATGDTTIDALPDLTMDTPLSTLSGQQRNRLQQVLDRNGVTFTVSPSSTMRELVNAIGTRLEPSFTVDGFDVAV